MKGRERNAAFFQQHDDAIVGVAGKKGNTICSNNTNALLKKGRSTGAVLLTEKKFTSIPFGLFTVEQDLEEGEKFWEIQPVVKVDLSNNEISDVPDEIGALTNLTTFRIRNNRIVTLSDKLFTTCTGIVHLDLSSNAITELSNSIGKLQFLAELYLSGNRLRAIPEYVCECTRLTILEVADNLLEDLPAAIGALRHLLRLNAAINRISEVPDSLCAISSLQDLDLKKNKISILPDLRGMTSLTVIDVSDNKLELYPSFPPGERSALARIYLGGNRIRHLPGENLVAGENTLVELDVQGNLLTEISPDIGILKNLKLLNASNNDLSDIPFTLGYMTSLQRIILDGNPLRTIRRSLLTQSTADLKKYLRTRGPEPDYVKRQEAAFHFADIDPFDGRIREMSGGVLNCSNLNLVGLPSDFVPKLMRASSIDCMDMTLLLVQLNLSNNKFTVIPGEISETATLQILDMSSNLLGQSHPRDIAHSLRSFPAGLQVLNVSKNGLSSEHVDELISIAAVSATIPYTEQQKRIPSTGAPCGIKSILCSQNRLNELPQRLRLLSSSLRELQVSFNFLTSLSGTDFNEFKSLEVFDGSNNKLKSLGNLHKALNLSDVLLSNNDIMDIPLEFGRLKKLRNFSVLGNPQKTVRLNVIQQGTDAIMKTLQLRLPIDIDPAKSLLPVEERTSIQIASRETLAPTQSTSYSQAYPPVPSALPFSPPPVEDKLVQSSRGFEGRAMVPLRDAVVQRNANVAALRPVGLTSNKAVSVDAELDSKIAELESQFLDLSASLDDPGLSEAKRFASKKNLAKIRANILRLNREKDSSSSARYS